MHRLLILNIKSLCSLECYMAFSQLNIKIQSIKKLRRDGLALKSIHRYCSISTTILRLCINDAIGSPHFTTHTNVKIDVQCTISILLFNVWTTNWNIDGEKRNDETSWKCKIKICFWIPFGILNFNTFHILCVGFRLYS